MQEKLSLRKSILAQRGALSDEQVARKSAFMVSHLRQWLSVRSFSQVFCFQPFRKEPDLTPVLAQLSKQVQVAMPVVTSSIRMSFYPVGAHTLYRRNKWGILEPEVASGSEPVFPDSASLILMPAVATDRNGHRLGYGGGFYDRFLENHSSILMVAIFSEFVVEALPNAGHDVRVNFILTENGVVQCPVSGSP